MGLVKMPGKVLSSVLALCLIALVQGIPTTTDGPFKPVTVPLYDKSFRDFNAEDLPNDYYLLQRKATGFEPEQISVALSANYDSVWISWITGEYQIGYDIKPLDPNTVASVVEFGRSKTKLSHKAHGHSLIYNQLYDSSQDKGDYKLRNYTSGIIHHARLIGLKPNSVYYYRCGDPSREAMSAIKSFRTMPVPGPKSYPERIAIVGDLGLTYNTTSTIDHMVRNNPDVIVMLGDVTYADLYLSNGTGYKSPQEISNFVDTTYQPRWDYWGRYMEPVISKIPMMFLEGNHDVEKQAGNKKLVAYTSRYGFPSSPLYYSFNAGADQYKWLKKDLAKVDRKVTPWLVVSWHTTWYATYVIHYREGECMRIEMEELLYKYGVDIVFAAHVHAYERSNRVYNYTLDPCGPVHITIGDGGNREVLPVEHADEPGKCPNLSGVGCAFKFTSGPAKGKYCWDRQPEYSAFRDSSFGHGILESIFHIA
ncbi:hypothetical protein K2173_019327 [Erythroxylum novogranatense]|uniref:Purple acid phosphatase n=1 Tax=Erythroxylum novogranatense TaxID=1862640 RepID=A0AAV8SUA3_9ROSI|nr:hypothetical protein K2173_019327 [Erythroxylum novogranatense]